MVYELEFYIKTKSVERLIMSYLPIQADHAFRGHVMVFPPKVEGLLVDGALTEGQAAIKKQKYLYERCRIDHFHSCVLSCLAFE